MSSTELRWVAAPPLVARDADVLADGSGIVLLAMSEPEAASSLVRAFETGITEEQGEDWFVSGGPVSVAAWFHLFEVLSEAGRLAPVVIGPDGVVELRLLRSLDDTTAYTGRPDPADAELVLAPEAMMFRRIDRWRIECPTAWAVADLTSEVMTAILSPAGDWTRHDVARALLREAGILVPDTTARTDMWEPHDRYFHWRSRRGGHPYVVGATYPLREKREALPVTEVPSHVDDFDLAAHASDASSALAMPIGEAFARRRSDRQTPTPLSLRALADFCLAHRALSIVHACEDVEYSQSRRLYPGGGATYELDLYLTTRGVELLPAGVWWFDAEHPRLCRVSAEDSHVEAIIADAMISTGGVGEIEVLVTYGLRMGRNSWKYEGMAYRLALLDAGVLYGHAYLLGAALGIGVCGLGNGDSRVLADVLGGDPWQVVSLAEVLLSGAR